MGQGEIAIQELEVRHLLRLSRRLQTADSMLSRRSGLLAALCRATGAVSGYGMLLDDQFKAAGDITVIRIPAARPADATNVVNRERGEPVNVDALNVEVQMEAEAPWPIARPELCVTEATRMHEEARELLSLDNPMAMPFLRRFTDRIMEPTATTRTQSVDDRKWYGSDFFDHFRRQEGLDDCILSVVPLPGCQPFFAAVCLSRPMPTDVESPDAGATFSERHRQLAELMHGELRWIYYDKPTADIAPLPAPGDVHPLPKIEVAPRLRRVLYRLLAGDSEKEAARHLGLSTHTVHEYIRALYREMNVSSRSELMARWIAPPNG